MIDSLVGWLTHPILYLIVRLSYIREERKREREKERERDLSIASQSDAIEFARRRLFVCLIDSFIRKLVGWFDNLLEAKAQLYSRREREAKFEIYCFHFCA